MLVAFDVETFPIAPGLALPPLVCVSLAFPDGRTYLLDHVEGANELEEALDNGVTLIGHNVAFDLGVLASERPSLITKIFDAYAAGRIRDTMIRELLIAIKDGELSDEGGKKNVFALAALAQRRCGITLDKNEGVRLAYGPLRGKPITEWPEAFTKYATGDALATLALYEAQADATADYAEPALPHHAVWSEPHECRAAWALKLMGAWGVRTDAAAIDALERELQVDFNRVDAIAREAGLVRENGTRDLAAIRSRVETAYGGNPPLTKPNKFGRGGGSVSTNAEVLEDSGDPALQALAERGGHEKIISTYLPALRQGTTVPINARWNVLVSSTRTSCGAPNLQNPPRAAGVRECIVPREGTVFSSVDYDTIELRALAHFCESTFGYSAMADAIRSGIDLHSKLAARLLSVPYEEAYAGRKVQPYKGKRELAKATLFGRGGGMGDARFIATAKAQQGLIILPEEAATLMREYLAEFPEMVDFFAYNSRETRQGKATTSTPGSGTLRGGCTYPACCNQKFQGPVAVGAKRALFDVSRECYTVPDSPLYGSRPVLFVHDEIILEIPSSDPVKMHEAAKRQAEVMIAAMQPLFPTVPITASPALMRRWSKAADAAYDSNGRLIPYEDAKAATPQKLAA